LKVKNSHKLLTSTEPKQINSHQGMIQAVVRVGNGVQNLKTFTGVKSGDAPATEARYFPEPTLDAAFALSRLIAFQTCRYFNGYSAAIFDPSLQFLKERIKHDSQAP
jgi:hypothetical protein